MEFAVAILFVAFLWKSMEWGAKAQPEKKKPPTPGENLETGIQKIADALEELGLIEKKKKEKK